MLTVIHTWSWRLRGGLCEEEDNVGILQHSCIWVRRNNQQVCPRVTWMPSLLLESSDHRWQLEVQDNPHFRVWGVWQH